MTYIYVPNICQTSNSFRRSTVYLLFSDSFRRSKIMMKILKK